MASSGEVPVVYEGESGAGEGILIPLLENAASAGYGADLLEDDIPVRSVRVPRHFAKFPHLTSIPAKGDSMEPTLRDGDLVVCDGGGWDGDGLYVLKTYDALYVKRVAHTPQGYQVMSDNKIYPSYIAKPDELSIVGRVRAVLDVTPGSRGGV